MAMRCRKGAELRLLDRSRLASDQRYRRRLELSTERRAALVTRARTCFEAIDKLERQVGRLTLRQLADHRLIWPGVWSLIASSAATRAGELVYWRRLGRTERGDRYSPSLSHIAAEGGRAVCGVQLASEGTHELEQGESPRGTCRRCVYLDLDRQVAERRERWEKSRGER